MLLPRQIRLYTHRVRVYRKVPQSDGEFKYAPAAETDLECRLKSTPNTDKPYEGGQQKDTNIFVLDHIRTYLDADLKNDDILRVTVCPGHVGEWYSVMGSPKLTPGLGGRVNTADALLNKTTKPALGAA